jgi:hypothetical protein
MAKEIAMTKYSDFVAANTPQEVNISWPEARERLKKSPIEPDTVKFARKETPTELRISWYFREDGQNAVWEPSIMAAKSDRYGVSYSYIQGVDNAVLSAALGIEPRVVKMPEQAVTLPLSAWTGAGLCDCGGSHAIPLRMFTSEAREHFARLRAECEKMLS